jgi:tight adherence protein C
MIYVTFFCSIMLFAYAFITAWSERREHVKRRLSSFSVTEKNVVHEETKEKKRIGLHKRLLISLWKVIKRRFKRRMPGDKADRLERKLLQAGSPHGLSPVDFRMVQLSLFLLVTVLAGCYALFSGLSIGGIIFLFFITSVATLFFCNYYLHSKIKRRSRQALRELPDTLDLLTVSLEAGLGFDSALSKLVSKKEGVLSSEFQRCLEEIRLGKTRRESLSGVKERLMVEEVSVLISSIIQAEKLGIGMVQVLRIQSQEVREQRKQRAEEEAMKAPIKMLFPLVLFIFPSLFIVLLGPAVIQFITTFNK